MAYIYLNKETLQTAINSLVSYSNSHASEVEACRNVNSSHGDEAGVGWRLADGGTLSEKGKVVKSLADEIKAYRKFYLRFVFCRFSRLFFVLSSADRRSSIYPYFARQARKISNFDLRRIAVFALFYLKIRF